MTFCLCYLWIFPVWIISIIFIIYLRYRSPRFLSARAGIMSIFKDDTMSLQKKKQNARDYLLNFHKFKGYRHSLARMVQADLKSLNMTAHERREIFKFIYK